MTAVGVVLGQGQGSDTSEILAAAGNAAEQLVQSAAPTSGTSTLGAPGPGGAPTGAVGWPAPAAATALPRARLSTDVNAKHDPQEHT